MSPETETHDYSTVDSDKIDIEMNFFTLYLTLIYLVVRVYSIPEPNIVKEHYYNLGKNYGRAHIERKPTSTPVHTIFHEKVNVSKRPEHPMLKYKDAKIDAYQYDDILKDFPRKQLEDEESPFRIILETLQSESVLPLWFVSPIYYLQEATARFVAYLISSMW
ncbi:hypothetical protein MN116_004223 [Schistosoma mekongi]|uniref:Uncharacterized protein n=1 Tax=Schistosoma mekongi TaxID=38744 RepID=A0AAE1ZGA2_SCHME|nr:hypothetical protein MN116_004223 [Schistosoma mekongi]